MSVQNATSRASYVGNASISTPYPVGFYFFEDADLVVTVTDLNGVDTVLVLNTDYTVSGAGNENGGEIVTGGGAIPATSTVAIARILAATQLTQYQNLGKFPSSSHERALDKLTMIGQHNLRLAGQSLRVRDSDGERTPLAAIANTVLTLNASKQPVGMTADELKSFLSISGTLINVDRGTMTFADSGERAAAVPEFTGQLGTQRDTGDIYISSGTSAGDWVIYDAVALANFDANFFTADSAGRLPFADGWLNAAKLASDAVTTAKILDAAVTAAKILDAAVTAAKLAATLDLSGKTLTMPSDHWKSIAPAGSVLQVIHTQSQAQASGSTAIPLDNTIPQNTEGTQFFSAAITPSSALNKILVIADVHLSAPVSTNVALSIFKGSDADAICSGSAPSNGNASVVGRMVCRYLDTSASASEVTYKLRAGSNSGTYYLNTGSTAYYGDNRVSSLTLMEIKG